MPLGAGYIFAAPMVEYIIGIYRTGMCIFGIDRNLIEGENLRQKCHKAKQVLFSLKKNVISPLRALDTRAPIFYD